MSVTKSVYYFTPFKGRGVEMKKLLVAVMVLGLSVIFFGCEKKADDAVVVEEEAAAVVQEAAPAAAEVAKPAEEAKPAAEKAE
jgi:uncharacterized lipoprotein NlpE involved in copper resistance